LIASIGCLCLIIGRESLVWWNIGAFFIGLGISSYSSLFRTIRDEMQDKKLVNFNGSLISGYIVYLATLLVILFFGGDNKTSLICLSFLIFSSLIFVVLLWGKNPYRKTKLYEKTKLHMDAFLSTLSILIFTFFVRFYRQTANIWIVAFIPLTFFIMLFLGNLFKERPYRAHSLRSFWYGATINFIYVFTLFYYTSVGKINKLYRVYFLIGLGGALSLVTTPLFKKFISAERFELFCMITSIITSCIMPISYMYEAGATLTSMFLSMGTAETFKIFLQDNRFEKEERRLIYNKFYGLGCVTEQTLMVLVILIFSSIIKKMPHRLWQDML